MSGESGMATVTSSSHGAARWLRAAALAIVLGVGMALWVGVAPALPGLSGAASSQTGGSLRAQIAQACGIGAAPTMMANKVAALAFPFNGNYQQEQYAGIFPLDYPVNQPITLYEDFSRVPFAPSPSSFTWRWDFGDGSATGSGVTVTHTFTQTGTYVIASDTYDAVSKTWALFDNAQIHVVANSVPNPPVAKATALTSPSILVGQSITFDGAGSHAVVGSKLTYTWNFGDNTSANGERETHTFTTNGIGSATLIVTDARGAQSMATISIAVGTAGSLRANASSGQTGTALSFNAVEPNLPAGPTGPTQLISVGWDFGDGTAALTTKTTGAAHSFAKAGTYTVAARLLNTDSSVYVAKLTVTITPAPGGAGGGSRVWLLGGGALALLVVIGAALYFWLAQQRKLALAQRRAARNRPGGRGGAGQPGQPRGRPNPHLGRQGPPIPAGRRLAPDRPGMPGASGSGSASRAPGGSAAGGYPARPRGGAPNGANGDYPQRPPMRPNGGNRTRDDSFGAGYGDDRASRPRRAPNSSGGAPSRPGAQRDNRGGYGNPGAVSRPNGYPPPSRPQPRGGFGGHDDYDE
ncbi:MAG TPA: PKD domain-containing protein [Ktedonobacterales bacterium]|nr:PKD domain-containing protein [Ktedonobacterales bacterium]